MRVGLKREKKNEKDRQGLGWHMVRLVANGEESDNGEDGSRGYGVGEGREERK